MYSAAVSPPSSSVSTETPCQTVSSFDHLVTQWMSTVTSSLGSARNSFRLQRRGSSTSPTIEKSHCSSGVCGVGPAERTGKSLVTYWPGGTRPAGVSSRRPRKPREMSGGISSPSIGIHTSLRDKPNRPIGVECAQPSYPLGDRRVGREERCEALPSQRVDDVERRRRRVDVERDGLRAKFERLERIRERRRAAEELGSGRIGEVLTLPCHGELEERR